MPIEIRELVIRAVVADGGPSAAAPEIDLPEDRAALVDACVKEVLRALDRLGER